jgi:hypothetical protein
MLGICDSSTVLRDVARRAAGPDTGMRIARRSIDADEKAYDSKVFNIALADV